MGAGILPLAFKNGMIFILLGKEKSNNLWSDFGGSSNKYETCYDTAIREFNEETNGFLGEEKELREYCENNLILDINYKRYKSFIINIPYSNTLPLFYNNNYKFIEKNLKDQINREGLFEKSKIAWYKLDERDLINMREKIRPHYYPILENLVTKNNLIIKKLMNKYK